MSTLKDTYRTLISSSSQIQQNKYVERIYSLFCLYSSVYKLKNTTEQSPAGSHAVFSIPSLENGTSDAFTQSRKHITSVQIYFRLIFHTSWYYCTLIRAGDSRLFKRRLLLFILTSLNPGCLRRRFNRWLLWSSSSAAVTVSTRVSINCKTSSCQSFRELQQMTRFFCQSHFFKHFLPFFIRHRVNQFKIIITILCECC